MQETKLRPRKKKKGRGESVAGAAETTACWRCGGVARGRWLRAVLRLFERRRVQLLLFPFSSVWLPLCFGGFICLGLLSVLGFGFLPSGLLLFSLLSLSSGLSPSFSSALFLSIYRTQNGAGTTFVSAPSITQRLVGH